MARQLVEKMKSKVARFIPRAPLFPMRSFLVTLAALLLTLFIGVGIFQYFIAPDAPDTQLSGKIIAVAEMPKTIIDEPIKTVHEPEQKPEDTHHQETANNEHGANETAHPLNSSDLPPPAHEEAPKAEEKAESDQHPIDIEEFVEGLVEETPFGPLPIVRKSDGLKSFDAYKAPFKLKPDTKGVVSLVLVDYGLSTKLAKLAFETLPPVSNFIASPYADNLQAKITAVRKKGGEVWMGLPMEGHRDTQKDSLGPNTILAGLTPKENINRANTHMGHATGYAGVAFHAQPPFTDGSPDLQSLINAVAARGLGIAQMDTKDHLIDAAAAQASAPFIGADLWVDEEPNKQAILKSLSAAEKMSLEDGSAVAVFEPSPLTFSLISEWQKTLGAKNIQLAPLSYAVHIAKVSPVKKTEPHDNQSEH